MKTCITKAGASATLALMLFLSGGQAGATKPHPEIFPATNRVDVVIALDVSGSMSGLIESAKQRLWDIVNELGRAQPQPDLRLAILTYGNPAYGEQGGYVRIDLPFTRDLDAVNETLFGFGTNGGDEYVARVVSTSVSELDWSRDPNALRIIFVAGNEAATQDPRITMQQATTAAARAGIVVNTIYCGGENDSVVAGWQQYASMTNGFFASIDQDAAAVANIATPMDAELVRLNQALNETFVAYGTGGRERRDNQLAQDSKVAGFSAPAMASRVVTKAGGLYDSADWDLVDAVAEGKELDEIEAKDLPEPLREMSKEERAAHIEAMSARRQEIQAQILELDKVRRDYIAAEKARRIETAGSGLDDVIQAGLRTLAVEKGYSFDD